MKKYTLVKSDTIEYAGRTLFRIRASMDFGVVSKGELGGYIEKEDNLSMDGNAWVSDNAWVSGNASVFDNAWVSGNASVFDNASVSDTAWVSSNARVYNNARVYGNAWVSDNAWVSGNAWVYGNARVSGNAWVSGSLKLLAGRFLGTRHDKEEIKYHPIPNTNDELIYKGEARFGEDEPKETIKIGDRIYNKDEVENALKNIKSESL